MFDLAENQNKESSEEEESSADEGEPQEDKLNDLKPNDMLATAGELDLGLKDQGFTRPKVLILTAFKQMAA